MAWEEATEDTAEEEWADTEEEETLEEDTEEEEWEDTGEEWAEEWEEEWEEDPEDTEAETLEDQWEEAEDTVRMFASGHRQSDCRVYDADKDSDCVLILIVYEFVCVQVEWAVVDTEAVWEEVEEETSEVRNFSVLHCQNY